MKKYFVKFKGHVIVKAKDEEEGLQKAWEQINKAEINFEIEEASG